MDMFIVRKGFTWVPSERSATPTNVNLRSVSLSVVASITCNVKLLTYKEERNQYQCTAPVQMTFI